MRTREEWEKWYTVADPWNYEESDEDILRTKVLLSRLRNTRFKHSLDLGCGEGFFTNCIAATSDNAIGYDISESALVRARKRYPSIEFKQGELLEVITRPEVKIIPFDLIKACEVLYYLESDQERREAIDGISKLGAPGCLYYFSVIVSGQVGKKRYFTHPEFLGMLSERFQVLEHFPCDANLHPLANRILSRLPFRKLRIAIRKKLIALSSPSRWKHVGYMAVKRICANLVLASEALATIPREVAIV